MKGFHVYPSKFYVYCHCRPDGELFYIGKGQGNRARDFSSGRTKHYKNIVAKYGGRQIIVRLFPCETEAEAFALEIKLIKEARDAGIRIVNFTDGGEGAAGGRGPLGYKHSEASRARMSAYRRGRPINVGHLVSEETRALLSRKLKGRIISVETRAKISATSKGKAYSLGVKHSEEANKRKSELFKGRKITWAHKIARALKGNKNGIGNKSHSGLTASAETRKKMSDAQKARRAHE